MIVPIEWPRTTTGWPMRSSTSVPSASTQRVIEASAEVREVHRHDAVVRKEAFGQAAEEVGAAPETVQRQNRRTRARVFDVHRVGVRP